jgi:hypothetical protein
MHTTWPERGTRPAPESGPGVRQRILPSGRVRYFPMSNVTADDQFQSLLTGEHYRVTVRKAVVDSAYWTFDNPSSRPPRYSVVPGVRCVPPNAISQVARQEDDFVVVGPGKTGIDSCLWLLERGNDTERIRWVMPGGMLLALPRTNRSNIRTNTRVDPTEGILVESVPRTTVAMLAQCSTQPLSYLTKR